MKPLFSKVFFDVDSTIAALEGIDFLSRGNTQVEAMTRAAMEGTIPLEEVYGKRLDLIRPGRRDIEVLSAEYERSVVPGAREVIATLLTAGVDVHLISGGIEQAIRPLARSLALDHRALHAVRLEFDEEGCYLDFDRRSPLTVGGGKELVIRDLRVRSKGRFALIGDGMSDVEARDVVDLFVGFGGVVVREQVRALSPIYLETASLLPLLDILMTKETP